jgi:hypothetical protein
MGGPLARPLLQIGPAKPDPIWSRGTPEAFPLGLPLLGTSGSSTRYSVVVAAVDVDAGHALGVEHVHVASVVLEGQPQVESEPP